MFKYEGISSSPPKALLSEGSWFLCSYTSCPESSLDLVLKIKQKLKPWEEFLCSVEYSVFLIKKKKSYLVPKCATYRPSGTALWLLCMTSQGCQVPVFLELGIGGLASAETMHRIGLLNKNLITYVLQKTAESGEILIWCCLRDGD